MTTQTAHTRIKAITERIIERSKPTREAYIGRVREAASRKPHRSILGCANLAHGFAASGPKDKAA
jgi:phosphogluconate dehydratase